MGRILIKMRLLGLLDVVRTIDRPTDGWMQDTPAVLY